MLSLVSAGTPAVVIAPRRLAARQLSLLLSADPSLRKQWRFTTSERLNRFILRCAGAALAEHAANALSHGNPEFSAAQRRRGHRGWLALLSVLALASLAPEFAIGALEVLLALLFLGWLGLRLAETVLPVPAPNPLPQMSDDRLPTQ